MKDYAKDHQLFVTDALVGADPAYKLQIKCINEHAWHHLFLKQLFIRPKTKLTTPAEFTLICMPSVKLIQLKMVHILKLLLLLISAKMVLIGGGAYAGEMKKLFSLL